MCSQLTSAHRLRCSAGSAGSAKQKRKHRWGRSSMVQAAVSPAVTLPTRATTQCSARMIFSRQTSSTRRALATTGDIFNGQQLSMNSDAISSVIQQNLGAVPSRRLQSLQYAGVGSSVKCGDHRQHRRPDHRDSEPICNGGVAAFSSRPCSVALFDILGVVEQAMISAQCRITCFSIAKKGR